MRAFSTPMVAYSICISISARQACTAHTGGVASELHFEGRSPVWLWWHDKADIVKQVAEHAG
jgi:hypothetical protein